MCVNKILQKQIYFFLRNFGICTSRCRWWRWQNDVFLTFLILLWIKCVRKKIKMYLSLLLRFLLFPKFLKYWKLTSVKKLIFNTTAILKRIIVFWPNHDIKMPQNSKIVKKPRNYNAAKISCLKVLSSPE